MKRNPILEQFIKGVGRLHATLYGVTGGFGGAVFGRGRSTLTLTTKGRKTGNETSTALLYLEQDGKLYVVASFGGSDVAPGWYRNLVKNPDVGAQVGDSAGRYRARSLTSAERNAIWPKLVEMYPSYATYQQNTTRVIPVVELTPTA